MTPFLRRRRRIEWGECDPAGIVYAPRFLDMAGENTVRLFEAAGLPKKRDMLKQMGVAGFPMVDLSAKFSKPAAYGDDVVIESAAPEFGESSFTIKHRVMLGDDVCMECTEKRVWTVPDPDHPGRLRPSRVPDEVRALFAENKEPVNI